MINTAESFVILLITYLFWYVLSFGNSAIVLYGSTIVSVICILIHILYKREIYIQDFPLGIKMPFVLVIYCVFTSLLFSENKIGTLNATLTFFAFTLVCFVISYISFEKQSIDWLINAIIVIVFLCCFWTTFYGTEFPNYGRVLGRYCNPHILGAVMNIGVFALAYRGGVNIIKSFFFMIMSIWPVIVIINCSSRKGLLAVFILYIFWGGLLIRHIFYNESNIMKIICVIIIALIVLAIIYYYNNIYINTTMAKRMSHFSEEESNTFRVFLYEIAINIFKDHPFFGVGMDGFKYVSITGGMSHSTYAESIADFGFLGCCIYYIPILHSLIAAVYRFFVYGYEYHTGLVIALIVTELFFGIGQVFFLEPVHFIFWTIIFCYLHLINVQSHINNNSESDSKYKYLRN